MKTETFLLEENNKPVKIATGVGGYVNIRGGSVAGYFVFVGGAEIATMTNESELEKHSFKMGADYPLVITDIYLNEGEELYAYINQSKSMSVEVLYQ